MLLFPSDKSELLNDCLLLRRFNRLDDDKEPVIPILFAFLVTGYPPAVTLIFVRNIGRWSQLLHHSVLNLRVISKEYQKYKILLIVLLLLV